MLRTRHRGFTLVELMIVAIVVGVLAAIALPAYRNQVIRANRAQAQQYMQDFANREEQYRLDARAYAGSYATLGIPAPSTDLAANYTLTPTAVAVGATSADCNGTAGALVGPAYRIDATAINSQLSDGNLCLDSNGNKAPTAKWKR